MESEPPPSSESSRLTPAYGTLGAGYKLGRYELLLPIAQGGMAVVWAARMRGSHGFAKIVAVKTMLPALSGDPHFQELFLTEAGLASRIKHPNVCEIFDLGEEHHVLYIVMEWIDGESLSTLLSTCRKQKRTIPFSVATKLVLDAAKGLHAAHELRNDAGEMLGLVHRDVSPQNILVTYDGQVKIVDFGVAKAVARSENQTTKSGHVKGKVQYMAPEQAFCDAIDRRTDVFTLGIVLYQLTTGVHPFRAENELATLARITAPEPVTPPETLIKGFPRLLSVAIMKALAKDPAERFATMAELARELETVATKLAALGDDESVAGFVRQTLGDRAAERAAAIKDALRDADARTVQRGTSTGAAQAESAPEPAEQGVSGVLEIEPAAKSSAGRRTTAVAVGLSVLVGLGVIALAVRPEPQSAAPAEPPAPTATVKAQETVSPPIIPAPEQTAPSAAPAASATAPPAETAAVAPKATAPKAPRATTTSKPTSTGKAPDMRRPDF